jgi:hypothetical protein
MSYSGLLLFSYSTPIARIVERPTFGRGDRCILVTDHHYSTTTSKHITYARRAVSHNKIFFVPNVGWSSVSEPDHQRNFDSMVAEARNLLAKAKRALRYGPLNLDGATEKLNDAREYRAWFNLEVPEEPLAALQSEIDAAYPAANTRAKVYEDREAERIQLETERMRIRQREADKANRERLLKWLNGESVQPPHTARPYIRIKDDQVETTWGASAPLADAINIYRLATTCRKNHNEWGGWQRPIMVGDFPLQHIDEVGTVRVGCHVLGYRLMRMVAEKAGIPAE